MENILKYEKLVNKIASKYSRYSNFEDLRQVGMIGLLKAVDKYKKSDTKFTTYAYIWIKGEILEYLRCDRNIKLSKDIISLKQEINICIEELTNRFNRKPTIEEISYFLDKGIKEIENVLIASESILSSDYTDENDINLLDYIPYNERKYDSDILDLYEAINSLEEDEKEIIKMRYFDDMTQSEVSKILNTNQVNISRKEEKILSKLRLVVE